MIEKIRSFRAFFQNGKILLAIYETVEFFFDRLEYHFPAK